jgi:hypothetical protein
MVSLSSGVVVEGDLRLGHSALDGEPSSACTGIEQTSQHCFTVAVNPSLGQLLSAAAILPMAPSCWLRKFTPLLDRANGSTVTVRDKGGHERIIAESVPRAPV